MAGMERFTQRARRVLSLAHQEAERMKCSEIGTEHLLLGLVIEGGGVGGKILIDLGVEENRIRGIAEKIGKFADGNISSIGLSPDTQMILELSVDQARKNGHHYIGTEHFLLAIVEFGKGAAVEILAKQGITASQIRSEARRSMQPQFSKSTTQNNVEEKEKKQLSILDLYTDDLTSRAERNEYINIGGQEQTLDLIVQILYRRIRNNPLVIGQPGTGKTAIAQHLAKSICEGNVPESFINKRVLSLNFYGLIPSASQEISFETRVYQLLKELKKIPVILFIDNLGFYFENQNSSEFISSFFDLFYSDLSQGNVQIICNINTLDFEKYIKGRQVFEKTLVPFYISEPNPAETIEILKAQRLSLEEHHQIAISDEILQQAVLLTSRFLKDRYFPEKALTLLDSAASAVRFSNKGSSDFVKRLRAVRDNINLSLEDGNTDDYNEWKIVEENLLEEIGRVRSGWDKAKFPILTTKDLVVELCQITGLQEEKITKFLDGVDESADSFLAVEDKLRVFLCHSSNDKMKVKQLYDRLRHEEQIDSWLDTEKLLPGADWDMEIRSAVRASHVVLVCLSKNSVTKEGYIQKEIKHALDIADEKPDGTVFIIPLRLEDCDVPTRLKRWQWLDMFEKDSYDKLISSLMVRANDLSSKSQD